MGRFINPFTDFGFKYLFGREVSKDILIEFFIVSQGIKGNWDFELDAVYGVFFANFIKDEDECETDFERWIYVLKNMEILERMPFQGRKAVFDRLEQMITQKLSYS